MGSITASTAWCSRIAVCIVMSNDSLTTLLKRQDWAFRIRDGLLWIRTASDSAHLALYAQLSDYSDFHTEASLRLLDMRGSVLLIDCHSFSSIPNLLNPYPPSDIDICIGYNDDETCPSKDVIDNIVQHFKSCGYRVGINTPFSNSKTFSVPTEYHTVMIEVNKKLYMNEDTLEKIDSFYRVKHDLQSLYRVLLRC